jgi:hypothetical protein
VAAFRFTYHAIIIDKDPSLLWDEDFKHKDSFYRHACGLVFTTCTPFLQDATVVIDGSGTKEFRRRLGTYLKQQVNEGQNRFIRQVKFQAAHSNNLLQLADMIVGAEARGLHPSAGSDRFSHAVRRRRGAVRMWPQKRRPRP